MDNVVVYHICDGISMQRSQIICTFLNNFRIYLFEYRSLKLAARYPTYFLLIIIWNVIFLLKFKLKLRDLSFLKEIKIGFTPNFWNDENCSRKRKLFTIKCLQFSVLMYYSFFLLFNFQKTVRQFENWMDS